MVRDALYNGSQTTNYVEADDGSLTKVSSYDNVYLNGVTSALSILAGGALASAAGQNTTGAVSAAENEVFNNSLSPKYAKVTAQLAACAGQGKQCYVQALATTQAAYQQAAGDVAAACGAGGDASACNVAKADRAQLYVNQKALSQSVATMTDANTPLSNALHTATLDGLTVLGGAVLGKILPALRSGWNSLSGSAAGASDNVAELTTVGDEPYAGPNGTSDGGMAHPVGSNNAVATNSAAYTDGLAYRSDLPGHLAGPDGFTKSGQLSGTHNLQNATAALDAQGATYNLTPTGTMGISELQYSYTNAAGKMISGSKTVYDPAIYSDQAMLDMSQAAGQRGYDLYLQDTTQRIFDLNQNGVNFRTYIKIDPKTGMPFVGNVHPIK
jgi:hypothetical protein